MLVGDEMLKKLYIYWFEPIFFLFFGLFHLHRIWGLIDRKAYSNYWLNILTQKPIVYYMLMLILLVLCTSGIIVFVKNMGKNYWWRWIYIFGGGYVLFDVIAVILEITWWNDLLRLMFDTYNPYWNIIWGGFILIGLLSFSFGIYLIHLRKKA